MECLVEGTLIASTLGGSVEQPSDIAIGALAKVLALYETAIQLDPGEPAYPWNIGSVLSRIGWPQLSIGYLARAIQLSAERAESDWAGAPAYLALAEVALDAGAYDLALTALGHAWSSDDSQEFADDVAELLNDVKEEKQDPRPQDFLVTLLRQLPEGQGAMGKGNHSDRYVVPNRERGGWDVVKEDHQRSSGHFARKTEAVDRAREIVKNEGGGEIRIQNRDGRLIDSDTVRGPRRGESPVRDRK
jgi:tetratricopeptide (TPR) repeat protein